MHTGRWAIQSGQWNASREDLAAAVAALDCPAVRRPVLKLGHSKGETPLWAGNPTGQPAVGWVDNLATTNSGHTLVGDFVGMPGWLGDVAASAYPDRSVEGSYDHRCQAGHTHPFVLTAVALLGVTPPGVGTLRSLQDVATLYGVQAGGGGQQVVAHLPGEHNQQTHGNRLGLDMPDVPDRVLRSLTRLVSDEGQPAARELAAEVYQHGHREGAEDLLSDWWDGGDIDTEAVEWAVARGLPDVRTGGSDAGDRNTSRDAHIDRLAALLGDENDAVDAFEDISDRAARDGLNGLLAQMWLAGVLTDDAVDFALANNSGVPDPRRRRVRADAAPDSADAAHVEGLTLGDSNVDLDLWSDGTVTLGWDDYTTRLTPGEAAELVAAFNRVRGGEATSASVGTTPGGPLRLLRQHGGDVRLDVQDGPGPVTLSDDDAYDVQTQLVQWFGGDGEVEAHLPGRHDQRTHGRRFNIPGLPGSGLRMPNLVPRMAPGSPSRSQPRTTPPRQRRIRTGIARADTAGTTAALDTLLGEAAQVPGAGQPRGNTPSLNESLRGIRSDVASGDTSPDEAMQQVSSLILRTDVSSNPRLGDAVNRAVGEIRDGQPAPTPPSAPDAPQAPSGVSVTDRVAQLRSAATRDEARQALDGLTAARLRQVADELNVAYGSGWRKSRIADAIVQSTVGRRADFESIERLGSGSGGGRGVAAAPVQVRGAADQQTGAMVALIPAEEELDRLAVDGGEHRDQLHMTLLFLGEAAAYPDDVRQALAAELREVAEVIPPGEADGMAISAFNPQRGKDTAIVLELGGDGLEDVHGLVEAAVEEVAGEAGLALPEQHAPWRPHVTLTYSDDLIQVARLADRAGPVRFDRLRLAFAGENVDIPLTGEGSDLDVDGLTTADMSAVDGDGQVVAQQSRRVTRSDRPLRRYWLRGKGAAKIRWGTGGDFTRCVRNLRKHVRDPKGLCATYHRAAVGFWPGDSRNLEAAFDPDQPRDGHGRWTDTMHTATLSEIASFKERFGKAIPPAWTDVQIADDLDRAPLLVTGRDGKGRRQAIYSAAHTQHQAAAKFQRVQEMGKHLDKLDHALERDAGVNDDAAALLLIRRLGMRPGSTRDTRATTQAYGATTLEARHVTVDGDQARLSFTGKKGVQIDLATRDPAVVDTLRSRLAAKSGDDPLFDTTEARTRDYMRSTGVPDGFLLKDLRTVHANAVALREIAATTEPPTSKREFQRMRRRVAEVVSQALGNTPTLALSSYINPTVFRDWVRDPAWIAAAADRGDAAMSRAEEKKLLAGWFATVAFDKPATGIPAVEPDPDDPDDDGRQVTASTEEASALPNPNPTIVHAAAQVSVDDVRTAYYRQAPQQAWIREFHTSPKRLIVANDADGSVARVDFDIGDDGTVSFGSPVPVRVEYVEDSEPVAASRMVYASRAESRPDVATQPPTPPGFQPADVQAAEVSNRQWSDYTDADFTLEQLRRSALIVRGDGSTKEQMSLPVREPDGTLNRNAVHAAAGGRGVSAVENISDEQRRAAARSLVRLYREELDETPPESLLELAGTSTAAAADDPPKPPAAEPDPSPTKEDDMSLTEVRQRLGLADDADEAAVLAAVDELKTKAEQAPDPQQVAAAAAAEKENKDLTKQVELLETQVQELSTQVSAAAAEKASTVKATVLDTAQVEGKFAPADRERWDADYDEAPEVVTRVLASIAPGTVVPVNPHGKVGDPQGVAAAGPDDEDERIFSKVPALSGATTEGDN